MLPTTEWERCGKGSCEASSERRTVAGGGRLSSDETRSRIDSPKTSAARYPPVRRRVAVEMPADPAGFVRRPGRRRSIPERRSQGSTGAPVHGGGGNGKAAGIRCACHPLPESGLSRLEIPALR